MAKKKTNKSNSELIEEVKLETVVAVEKKVEKPKKVKDPIDINSAQRILGISLKSPGLTRDRKISEIQSDIIDLTIALAKIESRRK